uniref:Endonuclease/exonuclease/phosphatase domain-containing protein n=1 Tax=Bracon brevicornis TaxID=1563983 RepID=A0A6V7JIJ4_9HYME
MDGEFGAILDRIVTDAKERSPVTIAGDFNAWAVEWGSKETNLRGQSLLEAFAVLDLQLLNDGELPTFIPGECTSMIDLTFTSSSLARENCNWEVSDIITLSDHRAIAWNTAGQLRQVQVSAQRKKFTG